MPAVPYREDDDDHVASPSGSRPRPREAWSSDEDEHTDLAPVRPRPPQPYAPALEGLTTTGAGVVVLVGTTIGAVIDALVSPGLGWIFFVTFFLMSAIVGLRLRGRDAWASVGVPPLAFIAAAGIAAQAAPVAKGNWVQRTSGDMATVVLDHPYILLIGTALAVVAFGYRALID
jgi:hypothetical protein